MSYEIEFDKRTHELYVEFAEVADLLQAAGYGHKPSPLQEMVCAKLQHLREQYAQVLAPDLCQPVKMAVLESMDAMVEAAGTFGPSERSNALEKAVATYERAMAAIREFRQKALRGDSLN